MSIYWEIFELLAVISIVTMLIAENRHPVRTLAWMLILVFLPIVGLVLFFFFGRETKKMRQISNEDLKGLKYNTLHHYSEHVQQHVPSGARDLANLLYTTNTAIPLTGNDIKVYTDFDMMFADLLESLRSAKHHIHLEFFKFEDDPIGRQVAEILVQRAQSGVEVRVQYDDVANIGHRGFFRRMEKQGVKVQPFIKVVFPFISVNANYRNHRKIVVVDGHVGYLGGMNLAQRYSIGVKGGIWRDTHIRVKGPAVSELQTCFLMDWQFTSKKKMPDSAHYYPQIESRGDYLMQVASSGPMDEWNVIMQATIRMINQSHQYIYIQSPYLIPTTTVLMALRNAALSGVDVRVMIPYKGDRGVVPPLATRSYVKEVLTAGVKVYFYELGYMHSKAIVSDDKVTTIGSTNMDVRSYEQDFEINAFIYDEELARKMKGIFLEDEKHCQKVDPKRWAHRSIVTKFLESLARLLSPLL